MLSLKKYLVFFSILLLTLSFYFSKNLTFDASSDTLILKNDESFEYFEYYNKIFPTKNFLVLAIKNNGEINKKYIDNINYIQNKINQIDGVESTFSIVDAPILLLNNITLTDLANLEIENLNNTKKDINLILKEFSNSPLFKDQLINAKKDVSSIIIYLQKNKNFEKIKYERKNVTNNFQSSSKIEKIYKLEKNKNNLKREKLITEIRNLLINQNNNLQYFLGGIDMITSDTINFVENDILIFSFSVLFFIIIVLFFIYRDFKWVLIPLITTMYSVIIMTGFVGLMNWEITAISANFISLMLILSISMNIHIINNYRINYSNEKIIKTLKVTMKNMFWPCFYTALTTIVAFGSLLFSDIKPVIDFGFIMAISLIFIFITSFSILPLIIYYFPKIDPSKNLKLSIINVFCNLSIKQANKILIINILVFVVSIIGINKLNVENSFINYFKSNTEIFKGMKLIDTELGGTTPLDILIKFKDNEMQMVKENNDNNIDQYLELEEDLELDEELILEENLFDQDSNSNIWFSNDKIESIKKIHLFLENKKEIGKVQSIYTLIEMTNLINHDPLSIFELSILYKEIPEEYKNSLIRPFLSIDNNMIKISARVKDSDNIKRNLLIHEIKNYIESNIDNIEEFKINGLLVLYNNMLQSLFSSQIKSFGIILLSIFTMFIILFKSLKLSIMGMIPNIIASTFILGLIGLIGIPLDIMTITIAAITIGIAVDNTIHYVYRFKKNKIKNIKFEELIKITHNTVGYAVLTTSITIAFGFSVLSLSNFIPTILFGIFTALAMLIAMLGVLLTLPSLINKFNI